MFLNVKLAAVHVVVFSDVSQTTEVQTGSNHCFY